MRHPQSQIAPVVQLDRASVSETGCCRFESCRAYHLDSLPPLFLFRKDSSTRLAKRYRRLCKNILSIQLKIKTLFLSGVSGVMNVECKQCGHPFEVPENKVGQTIDCPSCSTPVPLPSKVRIRVGRDDVKSDNDSDSTTLSLSKPEPPAEVPPPESES